MRYLPETLGSEYKNPRIPPKSNLTNTDRRELCSIRPFLQAYSALRCYSSSFSQLPPLNEHLSSFAFNQPRRYLWMPVLIDMLGEVVQA
jgi:hypothetical protein